MKKYLAFILLFFGIGCLCSCTAIDESGDTSCVPEGMVRIELPLSIAPPTQKTEGITRSGMGAPEDIETLTIEIYADDYFSGGWKRIYFDYIDETSDRFPDIPSQPSASGQGFSLQFDMPEGILQGVDKVIVTVRANAYCFQSYDPTLTEATPPQTDLLYMSGAGICFPASGGFSTTGVTLKRSICKLCTVVRKTDRSVLGNWEVDVPNTEIQLLHVPFYARAYDPDYSSGMELNPGYTDPGYGDYDSIVLTDFPSADIESVSWSYGQGGEIATATGYVQYFFENWLTDPTHYEKGVNTTSLRVKIPLHNTETGEDKFIERVIPVHGTSGSGDITSVHDYILKRNTAFLLDIQVLSPEDIEVNLHLQDWWKEVPVNGDISGESFTVDKTEVPVIPYNVTDPAPAFTVTAGARPGSTLDICLVDKNKVEVNQDKGFSLWHRQGDGSLMKAPADNHITYDLNSDLKVQVAFSTVKNGNTGGFFKVSCERSTRYIPIITPKYVRTDEMFNKTMTSNCYIAEKEGGYRFAGTVMGNGADGLPPTVRASMLPYNANGYLAGATPSPVIAPKSAKLLWQDVDGLITQVGFDTNTTSHGDVVFNVSGAKGPGNAVISVYDTVDPNDPAARVLWSWHIWCAPRPEEMSTSGSAAVDDDGKRIYSFMDRNLGATTADGSDKGAKGLLYRFARNVPMIHFDKEQIFNILGTDITSLIAWGEGPDGGNRTGKYWDNILFPLHYYTHWNSNAVRGMWGDDFMLEEGPDGVDFDDKTIYDPCPAGYKVPTYMAFLALKELYHSNSKVREENSGIYFTGLRGGELCFPWVDRFFAINPSKDGEWLAISQGGMSDAGILKYYSASPYTDNNEDGFHGPGTSLVFSYGQGDMLTQEYYYEGVTSLLPVRCVREREKE